MKPAEDRLYPSDNAFEIPSLLTDRQPDTGLLLPCGGWGQERRDKKNVMTWHFYVDDYRFENIWLNPDTLISTHCREAVEPNFSVYDTTPVSFGLQQIYKKRWIARYWQERGLRIYADLNVSAKFYDYNRLGIPEGYNAFATRGYTDRLEYLKMEIDIARHISGCDHPNMIVYGGGEAVHDICLQTSIIYLPEFKPNIRRKEAADG
ncbi:MAG: DUF4417 domain-containing protein [Bacteroidales bacterium]|nr:DUF4417 domain-containing protein [Bacteroidales bacterium]MBQ7512642.1 DUF4417 domain-containing protein [Prevotella sp.]